MATMNVPDYIVNNPDFVAAVNNAMKGIMLESAVRETIANLLKEQGFFTNMMVLARLIDKDCPLDEWHHSVVYPAFYDAAVVKDYGNSIYIVTVDNVEFRVKPQQLAPIVDSIARGEFRCTVYGASPMAAETMKIYAR